MELRQGRRALRGLLGAVALLAGACTSAPQSNVSTTAPAAGGTPLFANGGSVTVAVPYLPSNFNPSTGAGANRVTQMVMEQVWPQAFVIDAQFQPETTGFIDQAEVVGLSPMTVTYQIDPKATWSDGVPITASDFVYNWQQHVAHDRELPFGGLYAGYRMIASITGSNGGKTVTVVFKQRYSDWESLFANLIPEHIAQVAGWSTGFRGFQPADLVSGGPFEVTSYSAGRSLVLTRNPSYWGPPAHLSRIVFVVKRTQAGSLAGLQTGSVSLAELSPGVQVANAVANASAHNTTISATTDQTPLLWQLVFNTQDPLLGNQLVRKALALDTDRGELVANSIDFSDPSTATAKSRLYAIGQPGASTEGSPIISYNPAAAASLLASLGYRPGKDGYLRLGGIGAPLTITVTGPSGDPVMDSVEQQLQGAWAGVGIRLLIRNVPLSSLLGSVLPKGEYQLALAPFVMPVFPSWSAILYTDSVLPTSPALASGPSGLRTPLTTAQPGAVVSGVWPWSLPTPVGTEPGATQVGAVTRNVSGLVDTKVAAGFLEILGELNTSQAEQFISELDTLLYQDLPTLPLFQEPVSLVQQADLVNVSESPTWAGPFWDAQDWAIQLSPPVTTTTTTTTTPGPGPGPG